MAILIQREEDRVCFTIRNSGSHIPEDQISRLWESFYKVDKARTREYGGQGLGLYIVKTMMDLHQGGYGARNVEGGVEFWFTLAAVPVPIDDWEDDYDEEPFGEEPPVETLEDLPSEEQPPAEPSADSGRETQPTTERPADSATGEQAPVEPPADSSTSEQVSAEPPADSSTGGQPPVENPADSGPKNSRQ